MTLEASPAMVITTEHAYDASGRKLRSVNGIMGQTRDYVGGIEYVDGAIELVHMEEGRVLNNGGTYVYEYVLKDHLGNARSGFRGGSGEAAAANLGSDYYPFGLQYRSKINPGSPKNNYLYNGKELQDRLALYDYGARFYDPVIGRWGSVDPKAEVGRRWTPYNYGWNNPISNIDPDGMLAGPPSTHTDEKGQVLAVYNDGDLGIYLHEGAKSKSDIDKKYNSNNTSAEGIKIGSTLQEFSFVDGDALERGDIIPTGKINYNSSWAADNVNAVIWDMQGRGLGYYAANAKSSNSQHQYKYEIKYTALKEFGSVYHGSLLYDDVYASARDAGNFAAGVVQSKSIIPNSITTIGFGIYQQGGINSNVVNGPYNGETIQSGRAQELGREYKWSNYLKTKQR